MWPHGPPITEAPLTLQCSHRFLIALSTFIPRACWPIAAAAIFGRTPAAKGVHLGTVGIAEDSARVWIGVVVVVTGRRERARRLVASPDRALVVRRQRAMLAWLAIVNRKTSGSGSHGRCWRWDWGSGWMAAWSLARAPVESLLSLTLMMGECKGGCRAAAEVKSGSLGFHVIPQNDDKKTGVFGKPL